MKSVDFLNFRQSWAGDSPEVGRLSPPESCGIIARLRPVLNEHGLDGESSLLVPPKDVSDDSIKILVASRDGQKRGVLFWSSPNAPQAAMLAAKCAASAKDFLNEDLGRVILEPLTAGVIDRRAYVLWPWWQPISTHRLVRAGQSRFIRRHLFSWLAAIAGATARRSAATRQAFAESLQYIAEHQQMRAAFRLQAQHALTRLENNQWDPCHVLTHNDFWLGNVLLQPLNSWVGAAAGRFAVIDWGASTLDGYAFYDLIRIASSIRITPRRLKYEILSHCRLLDCEPIDSLGYLIAALGHIGLRPDCFPVDRYIQLVEGCMSDYYSADIR